MKRKCKSSASQADKSIVIDPHRGVEYYDDLTCAVKKYHARGVKNIYSIVMTYVFPKLPGKRKVIRMDYGSFNTAEDRFLVEHNSAETPISMRLKSMDMVVSTFQGSRMIHKEILKGTSVKSSPRRMSNGW